MQLHKVLLFLVSKSLKYPASSFAELEKQFFFFKLNVYCKKQSVVAHSYSEFSHETVEKKTDMNFIIGLVNVYQS